MSSERLLGLGAEGVAWHLSSGGRLAHERRATGPQHADRPEHIAPGEDRAERAGLFNFWQLPYTRYLYSTFC